MRSFAVTAQNYVAENASENGSLSKDNNALIVEHLFK